MAIGAILFTVIFILPLKYLIQRSRPTRVPSVPRYINMRKREGNQPAHPSGDAAIAAFFFSCYFYIFQFPYLTYILLPIVCLGRVWMFCHWIGDTVVGAALGLGVGYLWFSE